MKPSSTRWLMLIGTIAVLFIADSSARASSVGNVVIFSNLTGPCCGGDGVEGANFGSVSLATAFTPVSSDFLANAQVVVFSVLGGPPSDPYFNMALFSDAGGAPGSLIEQLGTHLTAPPAYGGVVVANSALHPSLLAGLQYWLVLTPYDNATSVGWEQGGNQLSPTVFTPSPVAAGGWESGFPESDLQFEIDGTEVPEPSRLPILASVIGLIALRRLKRNSVFAAR